MKEVDRLPDLRLNPSTMSVLLQAQNLDKRYGPQVIFDDAGFTLSRGEKIAVIGRNGSGKSTLCKLITGEEELDSGKISLSPRVRLGYLEQKNPYEADETVMGFLQRYTGREEWECGKVAGRFQIKGELLEETISNLPGGYQTRVKLTAMLLEEPDFLILDEPTNYLDLRTLLLLEKLLGEFAGGFLLVSHDREFLKRTCNKTLEVERGQIQLFPGDVESYVAYKAEQTELSIRQNRNTDAKRRHLQEFVDRYRVRAATASRAQSKLKEMEKLSSIEIDNPLGTVRIRLPSIEKKKGTALRVESLSIGYPEHCVASDLYFEIERGEKVAVVGDNGEGKTTFVRTVADGLPGLAGEFRWAHGLEPAYYAQHVYSSLPRHLTVEDCLRREAAPEVMRQELLDMAGCFLFQGIDVKKSVDVLSGGERARLCLAGLLLSKKPVLLLDEPTNHLDFETVESLGRALREYDGTIFFVSHDRTFVHLVATSILEVKGGSVRLYPDGYDAYVYRMEQEAEGESDGPVQNRKTAEKRPNTYAQRKELRSSIGKLERRVKRGEKKLASLEAEREEINRYYLENSGDYSKDKQERLEEIRIEMTSTEEEWLALQEELERLQEEEAKGPGSRGQ